MRAVRVTKLDLVWSLIFRLPVYARPVRGA